MHTTQPTHNAGDETPIADQRVGELVARHPSLSRVFQAHQIDFCCQGSRSVREACASKGVNLDAVLAEIDAARQATPAPEVNPATLPPAELCRHIVETHHAYLRDELPRLHAMAQRVAHVHGGGTPTLVDVFDTFCDLAGELAAHMEKEERILFPAITAMAEGGPAMPLDGPVSQMMHEHDDAGAALARLRELTGNYQPPSDACNTYRALFAGLAELEEDLHTHIHLENSVLFPAGQKLASAS